MANDTPAATAKPLTFRRYKDGDHKRRDWHEHGDEQVERVAQRE